MLDIGDEIYFERSNITLKVVSYDLGNYKLENKDGSGYTGYDFNGIYAYWVLHQVIKSESVKVKKFYDIVSNENQVSIE